MRQEVLLTTWAQVSNQSFSISKKFHSFTKNVAGLEYAAEEDEGGEKKAFLRNWSAEKV